MVLNFFKVIICCLPLISLVYLFSVAIALAADHRNHFQLTEAAASCPLTPSSRPPSHARVLIKCEFALLCRLMVCFLVARRRRRVEVVNGQQLTGAVP